MNKGHLQNILTSVNLSVDPFGPNVASSQVYKAAERLVLATFMVTNVISASESVRARIRDTVTDILDKVLNLRKGFNSAGKDSVRDITAQIRLILSLLDVLYVSNLISQMNLDVLKNAFIDFAAKLEELADAPSADAVELSKDFFDFAELSGDVLSTKNNTKPPYRYSESLTFKTHSRKKNSTPIKDEKEERKHESLGKVSKTATVRINNIIEFISKKGKVSLGDISTVITGCSTKTLQRDLNALVSQNILKKEGAKRWTRYYIS